MLKGNHHVESAWERAANEWPVMSGILYVVATPIGNLEDLSPRARQTLTDVDLIAAEDTRRTGRLLSHIGCETRQMSLHEHNEARIVPQLVAEIGAGRQVALVSDAGTPLVSDPGFRLVQAARKAGLHVSPVPGPSSVMAALSVAGLPTDRFCFEGFLPAKQQARRQRLTSLASEQSTIVFFESVHRIAACLADLATVLGVEREAFVGRELTKLHEDCVFDTLGKLTERLAAGDVVSKGEFVIVVAGAAATRDLPLDADLLLTELAAELPARKAARIAARVTGARSNDLYQRLMEIGRPEP